LYKNINPCIATDYNRTFDHNIPIPKLGLALGGGMFGFATIFNFTIPMRTMFLAVPILIDFFRISSDSLVEARTSEFLDWVIGYRKSKSFAERYRPIFHTDEVLFPLSKKVKKVIHDNNLNELGRQLVSLAQG
jgi:hypothetical protein